MNRQTYLDQASLAGFGSQSLLLARTVITAEDVSDAAARVKADIRKHSKSTQWASFVLRGDVTLAVAAVLALSLLGHFFVQAAHPALVLGISVLVVIALASFLHWTVGAQEDRMSVLLALEPIAGRDSCESALKLVKKGRAEVLAWRDLAIAERGQLHNFDVVVMCCLDHQVNEVEGMARGARHQEARQLERKRELEEACRIVHGI